MKDAFTKWFNEYKPYPMEGEEHLAATAWSVSEKRMLEFALWFADENNIPFGVCNYDVNGAFDYWKENVEKLTKGKI